MSVAGLPRRVEVAADGRSVTVSAGLRYGDVAQTLHTHGLALGNLASLPHISVAGSVITATHGSGDGNRCLAAAVAAVTVLNGDGSLRTLRRGDPDCDGSVVSLGALGVMTKVTPDVVPAFDVRQHVYDDLPLPVLVSRFDEVTGSAYSVSAFTDWKSPLRCEVWRKQLADAAAPPRVWLGAHLADGPRHPVPGMPLENCTPQQGSRGPWHERLPHFRLEFTPSSGEELQSEHLIPRADGPAALEAVAGIAERVAPVVQTSEVRSVAADDLWLSPAYGRDSVGLHFTWQPDAEAVAPVVALVEERLAPFGPRPHWGKVFSVPPATVVAAYPRAGDFAALRRRVDPTATFRSEYVEALFPD